MTIIYATKEKREQARRKINPELPYLFATPSDPAVDHSASRVVVVGPYHNIADMYKGICKVEFIEIDEPKAEPKKDK